jgi:hypothetical protein
VVSFTPTEILAWYRHASTSWLFCRDTSGQQRVDAAVCFFRSKTKGSYITAHIPHKLLVNYGGCFNPKACLRNARQDKTASPFAARLF